MDECESLLSEFERAIASGSFDEARTHLRGLIQASAHLSSGDLPFDQFALHARLDPQPVSLQLLLTDFSGQPQRLREAHLAFQLNGQDDLSLLTDLAAGALSPELYRAGLMRALERGYGPAPCSDGPPYPLGFPNCLQELDLFAALQDRDGERLKDLLYDGMSRAWDHAFPDYDVFLDELTRCESLMTSARSDGGMNGNPGCVKSPWVRFGMASLLDLPIAVVLVETCLQSLPVWSFSPLQIAAGLLGRMADRVGRNATAADLLTTMPAAQKQALVNSIYFSELLPAALRLDLAPQVLEFASMYGSLADYFRFILPPVALDQYPLVFTACPSFYRHYPLPFLAEPDALTQVLQAARRCAAVLAERNPHAVIQLPDDLLVLSAEDAYARLCHLLGQPPSPPQPSALFERAWQVFQLALHDAAS